MTHSKTPWEIVDGYVLDANGDMCFDDGSCDLKHAVSCVNAIGDNDPEKLAAFIEAAEAMRPLFEALAFNLSDPKYDYVVEAFDKALREYRGGK